MILTSGSFSPPLSTKLANSSRTSRSSFGWRITRQAKMSFQTARLAYERLIRMIQQWCNGKEIVWETKSHFNNRLNILCRNGSIYVHNLWWSQSPSFIWVFFSIARSTSTDRDEWVFCSGPDPDVSLLEILLSKHGLLEAREQVAVLAGVSQSICCLLVDLGQTLLPQPHHPGGKQTYAAHRWWIM